MGLASKLAAAGPPPGAPGMAPMAGPAANYPGQAPTAGYPPVQPGGYPMQQQGGYPMQQQPGYPMQQQAGYPLQQQPGYPAPQGGWGPAPSAPAGFAFTPEVLIPKLQSIVDANQLHKFYPPAKVQAVATHILQTVNLNDVASRWRLAPQQVLDLCSLALYDVIIYADDSGSMKFCEDGERIEDLKLIMAKVSEVAALFDSDGIQVRFINSDAQGNGIKCAADASALISKLDFQYDTKLARNMKDKILKPIVFKAVDKGTLQKPVLIITITDGEPSDTPKDKIKETIHKARKYVSKYGPKAIAFQFAQVGNDQGAQDFLAQLDNDPKIGSSIDCTSNYELEAAEMMRKRGMNMTVESWLCKMMCGAIDPTYDRHD